MPKFEELENKVKVLVASDPEDVAVPDLVEEIHTMASQIEETLPPKDLEAIHDQIKTLYAAASIPARNYARIASILASLSHVLEVARRPGNEASRAKIASVSSKISSLFSEMDVKEDLSSSLSDIEKVMASLYSGKVASAKSQTR